MIESSVRRAALQDILAGNMTKNACAKKHGISVNTLRAWIRAEALRPTVATSGLYRERERARPVEPVEPVEPMEEEDYEPSPVATMSKLRAENARLRQLVQMLIDLQVQAPLP